MWLKSIENVNDNYWYGDVEYYNGAEAMDIAGLTEEELQSSLPGLKTRKTFFVNQKLRIPKKIN